MLFLDVFLCVRGTLQWRFIMKKKEHTIWESASFLKIEDWRDDIISEHPELADNEEKIYEKMVDINDFYLEDERINLNIKLPLPILVIADLGLWNGRHTGYKEINSCNIQDCLYSENPENRWYVDSDGEFRCESKHHDGTNYYWYRTWRRNISENKKEEIKLKLYEGTATEQEIKNVTATVGSYIAKVYGW